MTTPPERAPYPAIRSDRERLPSALSLLFSLSPEEDDTDSPQTMRQPESKTAISLFDHDRLFSRTVVACAG